MTFHCTQLLLMCVHEENIKIKLFTACASIHELLTFLSVEHVKRFSIYFLLQLICALIVSRCAYNIYRWNHERSFYSIPSV